jgi:hypothetical protein
MAFVTDFLAIVGAWVAGIWTSMVAPSIEASVLIFFDGTNITTIGVLALFGLAMALVMFGLSFVKGLIKR